MSSQQRRPPVPWMKFYPTDFLGDSTVATMSTHAVGAYILLLCHAWQQHPRGTLLNDDARLARLARLSAAEWRAVRDEVLPAFRVIDDGKTLLQPRMADEASAAEERRDALSAAGRRGAASRWGGHAPAIGRAIGVAMAYQKPEARGQRPEITPSDRHEAKVGVARAWEVVPRRRRRGKGGFVDEWIERVVRQGVGEQDVIDSIKAYYDSPEGQSKWARGPRRLISDEVWNEDASAWLDRDSERKPSALDAAIAAKETP